MLLVKTSHRFCPHPKAWIPESRDHWMPSEELPTTSSYSLFFMQWSKRYFKAWIRSCHNSISNLPVLSYLIQIDSRFFTMVLHHYILNHSPCIFFSFLKPTQHCPISRPLHCDSLCLKSSCPRYICDLSPFHLIQAFASTSCFERGLSGPCYLQTDIPSLFSASLTFFIFILNIIFNYLKYDMPHLIDCFSPLKLMLHGAKTLFILFMQYV